MNLVYERSEKAYFNADSRGLHADSRGFSIRNIREHPREIRENPRLGSIFQKPNYKGLTLMEVLISMLLLSLVFLAVTAIFLANQRFFLTVNSKAILESELGYALDHMQKNIVQGVGDKNNPAVISSTSDSLQVRIDKNVSPTFGNYSDDTWISYTRSLDGKLIYNNGSLDESLCPDSINVTNLTFSLENDFLVNIQLTGSRTFGDRTESLILYTTAFPRLMSNK